MAAVDVCLCLLAGAEGAGVASASVTEVSEKGVLLVARLIPVVIVHRAEQVPVVAPLWARWTVIGCMMVAVVLAYLHYRTINKRGRGEWR